MKARFVLLLAVVVLIAGCTTGGGGGAQPTDGTTDDIGGDGTDAGDGTNGIDDGDGTDATDNGDDTNGIDDGGSSDDAVEWEPFDFDTPARYEYEVFMDGDGTGSVVWDVKAIDGDQYTVELVYEMNGERTVTSATGSKDTIAQAFYANPGGIVLLTTMYSPAAFYEGRDLSTGTQWSYQTPDGSASFAITGTDRIGGVDCSRSEMHVDEQLVHEGCFAPDLGLAPYAAWYDDDGGLEMSLTLVSYDEN